MQRWYALSCGEALASGREEERSSVARMAEGCRSQHEPCVAGLAMTQRSGPNSGDDTFMNWARMLKC